jgi:CheY-like chemotaxis protein
MPVYSVPVANILNGVFDKRVYKNKHGLVIGFTAPEAKVLIVDDITTNLKVAQGLLLPYNMSVDLCKSGVAAIEAVKSKDYDMVLMDHKMPDMGGIEAAQRIRKMGDIDKYFKELPIIALTANAISGTREIFINSGFNDFISKPIDTVKLDLILETWIPKHKQKEAVTNIDEIVPLKDEVIKIDGLNAEDGISKTGGSTTLFIDALMAFCEDGRDRSKKIKECLEKDNISLYTTHVHGIKSASAFIGADGLFEVAGALEKAGKLSDVVYIQTHTAEFLRTLEGLIDNIHKWLNLIKPKASATAFDQEKLKMELAKLKNALGIFDAASMNTIINSLLTLTQGNELNNTIKEIADNILVGEFDEAVVLAESLLNDKRQ